MQARIELIALLIFLLFWTGCNSVIDEPTPINLDLKSKALVEADNTFGLEMFRRIHEIEEGSYNISPLSVSLALAMTYNGARGETKAAMEEAMKLTGFTIDEINQSYQLLVKALLEADDKVTLEIAQSIWYRMGFNVLDEFINVNKTYYESEVNELDFSRNDALDIINGWIEDKTHGKIEEMIEEIDPNHVMFLVNAIYFKGVWKSKFEKENTTKKDFTKTDGTVIQVDMMSKTDSVNIFTNELLSAIEMPYGHGNFNMVVLLPNEGKTCTDVVSEMTPENWKSWMTKFNMEGEINIWLPKFKAEYEIELNDVLSAMGMEIAFNPWADFSGINGTGGIWIDFVQHNTFIDVNEEGTEAAAATVVAIREFSAMPNYFKADKPFIYAITEKETGAILFLGKMTNPEYVNE